MVGRPGLGVDSDLRRDRWGRALRSLDFPGSKRPGLCAVESVLNYKPLKGQLQVYCDFPFKGKSELLLLLIL